MSLVLILFLGLLAFQFLASQAVLSIESKVDISAYFKTDAPEEQILQIKKDLLGRGDVASVDYVSKDQALADFKILHAGDQLIQDSLSQLDSNPLTASLNIKTKDTSQYAAISQFLKNNKYADSIDKINFDENRQVIEKIRSLSGNIKNWGLATTLAIALIAVLVTFNTVRLTIYNQRQEIEIMRLVGASNWQIRGPYLAEGGFYGLLAAAIALIIFYPVLYFISDGLSGFVGSGSLFRYFFRGLPEIVVIVAALGVFLGVFSSFIAIRRHLKV